MLIKSAVLTQASGSIGGMTAQSNKGGLSLRARAVPVNPNTPAQQLVKSIMATLVTRWGNTLSALQRDSWATYAANVPVTNALGTTIHLSGQNMFIRSNVPRLQVGLSVKDAAPVVFNLGALTSPILVTASAAAQNLVFQFTNSDPWAIATGGALLVYAARQQGPGINFFKGPYQFAGRVNGAGTPPTSPATVSMPFAMGVANRLFCRMIATAPDGRLSAEWFGGIVITT